MPQTCQSTRVGNSQKFAEGQAQLTAVGSLDIRTVKVAKFCNAVVDLKAALNKLQHFQLEPCKPKSSTRGMIRESKISSKACDIGHLLQDEALVEDLDSLSPYPIVDVLEEAARCLGAENIESNTVIGTAGYYNHLQLLDQESHLKQPHMRAIHEMFIALLRQLNLTFNAEPRGYHTWTCQPQAAAFLRFAESVEDRLRGMEETPEAAPMEVEVNYNTVCALSEQLSKARKNDDGFKGRLST